MSSLLSPLVAPLTASVKPKAPKVKAAPPAAVASTWQTLATAPKIQEAAPELQVFSSLAKLSAGKGSADTLAGPQPGMVQPGNIDLHNRPIAHNLDGSISTVRSITVTTDQGAVLIPTVIGGKVVSNKAAVQHWRQTGENLGTFTDERSADAYSVRLHNQQAAEYAQPLARPSITPDRKPTLDPPKGLPVTSLLDHGFTGGIGNLNDRVAEITASYLKAYGTKPTPALALELALSPVDSAHFPALFTVPTNSDAAAAKGTLAGVPSKVQPLPAPTNPREEKGLLDALRVHSQAGQYDDFMGVHGDQVQAMLDNPATRARTQAALAEASQLDSFEHVQESGGGLQHAVVKVGESPAKAAWWAARTAHALGQDADAVNEYRASDGKKGSLEMVNLQATAPALAQVVKGLVYSPAGAVESGVAVSKDLDAARKGDFSFTHTAKIASQTKDAFLADLGDPSGHAGYLALDLFGVASVGAGIAARVGRAATVAEGESRIGAATAPHPPRTETLTTKGGFSEAISISRSPLTAWLQKFTPGVGTKAQQARLDSRGEPAATTLAGEPVDRLGPTDPVTRWVGGVLSPEARIGRAGNIARQTEQKAMMGIKAEMDQAAGTSRAVSFVAKILPGDALKGLTIGEVKALQALSWDDPHPIAAEEAFHQSMIEQGVGVPGAHEYQLATLKLARDALANPSKRFTKTLEAYGRVVAETQRLRIDMGLGVDTADARVARAGAILRGEAGDSARVTNDSWYTPTVPKGKSSGRRVGEAAFGRGLSPFGFGPPTGVNLFSHEMTGEALRNGDIRIDVHHLAGEGYAKTVRASMVIDAWKKAWDHATPTRTSEHDVAVRDIRAVPDELRAQTQQFFDGHVDSSTADGLPDAMQEWLFPKAPAEIDNVRYIDPRLLGNAGKPNLPTGWGARQAERVNNLLRPWILYGPKYAINAVGNAGMLALDQGFMRSGQNLARAIVSDNHLSPEAFARLKSLTGGGKAESYINPRSGRVSKGLADFWSSLTDDKFRMASWLYHAHAAGYKDWASIEEMLLDETPEMKAERVRIQKPSDDALVAFDRLSPWEKATLRHYIFVYPWQRGAAIWAFRTVFEHPAKSAILATLGQEAYQNDTWLEKAPGWMRRVGYIPFKWVGDVPIVGDASSVNTFGTIAAILQTIKGAVEGDKYAVTGDLLGPPGQFAVHAALGVDQYGNAYPGSQWFGAAEEALNIVPLVAAAQRFHKPAQPPLKPFDVTHRASLEARLNSALKQSVTSPGWLGGYASLIGGGMFSGRELNLTAAAARYWRDATPRQKHQREVQLLNAALGMQANFLNRPVPDTVRAGVKDQAQITWAQQVFAQAHGRNPTEKEQLQLTIQYVHDAGRIDDKTAKRLTAQALKLEALVDVKAMSAAVKAEYAGGKALHQWDNDVLLVASLRNPSNFNARAATLQQNGLVTQRVYHLSEAQRVEYGRGYTTYLNDRRALQAKVTAGTATAADLVAFDDAHDKPVNGLPSYTRFAMTEGTTAEQQARIARTAGKGWQGLSIAEKAALGRQVTPDVQTGWRLYNDALAAQRERDGSVDKDGKLFLAKQAQKRYPGFLQDWLYSQKSRAERIVVSPQYKRLPDDVSVIVKAATQVSEAIRKNGHPGYYKAQWKQYVEATLQPWVDSHPELKKALAPYGRTFVEGLVNSG